LRPAFSIDAAVKSRTSPRPDRSVPSTETAQRMHAIEPANHERQSAADMRRERLAS
jgi:hypothetical protein